MYAASDRGPQIGKRRRAVAVFALLAPVLAGCGATGGDNPALSGPESTIRGSSSAGLTGPAVTVTGDVPQVAGQAAINTELRQLAPSGCSVSTLRDDATLASFRWVCGTRTVSTATFSLSDGLRLTLADLFVGGYLAYLSATADAQLQADGVTNPVATDFSAWALTPDSLEVTFPAGTVSFPLVSLTPYLRHPGPLQP